MHILFICGFLFIRKTEYLLLFCNYYFLRFSKLFVFQLKNGQCWEPVARPRDSSQGAADRGHWNGPVLGAGKAHRRQLVEGAAGRGQWNGPLLGAGGVGQRQ